MTDDNDDKPRGRSGKPQGDRPKRDFRGGKPGFGDKKPGGGKRPFVKRADGPEGERRSGPRREFKRDDRPRGDGERGERPAFRKGPRPDGKPFEKREGGDFRPGRRERTETAGGEAGAERPKRAFSRDDRPQFDGPRAERGDKPFRKGPPREGRSFEKRSDGERKPFRPREDGDRKPFRPREDGDRKPFRSREEGERKPFRPREEGDRKPFRPREDGERRPFRSGDDGPRRRDDKPRSFGMKSHGGQKRSYGMKSHDAERKPFRKSGTVEAEAEGERIAKRLARAGIASRRDAEELIAAGRVKVNGRVLESPAFNVKPGDTIHLDDTEIPPVERTRLFLFHKPAGVVTTNRDPEGRRTVFDILPSDLPRLMTVGRLDINTEGLLLLTNDGGLSRVLELPATGWLRRYRVRVHGKVDEKALAGLKDGIAVDGVFYGAVEAELERTQGTNAWLSIGLREGKNREVKNILGALGLEVTRLIRVSYGPFQLGELPEGHVLEIKGRTLRDQLGEKLIEEAGADFEADIVKPFSNKPARREHDADDRRPPKPRGPRPLQVEEGGLIKNRRRDREAKREDALDRLSTKPERGKFEGRGADSGGKFGDKRTGGKTFGARKPREERGFEPPKARSTNVWMAPGARPQGEKGKTSKSPRPRGEGKGDGSRPAFHKGSGPRKPGAGRPSKPPRGR